MHHLSRPPCRRFDLHAYLLDGVDKGDYRYLDLRWSWGVLMVSCSVSKMLTRNALPFHAPLS